VRRDFESGQLTCSFCGKGQREVRKLIAGPTVYICDECIRLCTDIIAEDAEQEAKTTPRSRLPYPQELAARLDEYIIGQVRAKKVLSVAVYNHFKRIRNNIAQAGSNVNETTAPPAGQAQAQTPSGKVSKEDSAQSGRIRAREMLRQGALSPDDNDDAVELAKSNVLLVGPTGTGKTLLAQTMAKLLDVPFTIADATTLTEAGYVGEDVENIIANLLIAADNDVSRAERGIIYIDEIDKVARKGESMSMTRDVSGEGVQQALLKIIEGTRATVNPRGAKKYGQNESVQIDTSNILVICGGSFTGIDQIIRRRVGRKGLGFGADVGSNDTRSLSALLADLEPADLQNFGLIPEFVGRLPVIVTLDELHVDELTQILTEPRNALVRQYQKLFALEHVDLEFDDAAIECVARAAIEDKSGARGLRGILESAMLDIMYEVPFLDNLARCRITRDVITDHADPELEFAAQKSA